MHFKPMYNSVIVVCYTTKSVNLIDCCLSWFQQTPLHAAAREGDVNQVKILADTEVVANSKDINGASYIIQLVVDNYTHKQGFFLFIYDS